MRNSQKKGSLASFLLKGSSLGIVVFGFLAFGLWGTQAADDFLYGMGYHWVGGICDGECNKLTGSGTINPHRMLAGRILTGVQFGAAGFILSLLSYIFGLELSSRGRHILVIVGTVLLLVLIVFGREYSIDY